MDLYKQMNVFLANQTVLYKKVQNLHWNLKGKAFFALHQKYDDLYNQLQDIIDEVAERLLAVGVTPVSSYKEVLKLANIEERESKPVECEESVKILLKDLGKVIKDCKQLAELAGNEADAGSEDIFVQYTKDFEKLQWMLNSCMSK